MKKIFIGGINGVGKSSIIDGILKSNNHFGYFSYGKNMQEISEKIYGHRNIEKLGDDERLKIRNMVSNELNILLKSNKYKKCLFDTHGVIIRGNDIKNTFKDEDFNDYDEIFVVTSLVENIINRIEKDKKRNRNELLLNIDFITKYQKMEIERINFLSKKFDKKFTEIINNDLEKSIIEINLILNAN